METPGCARSDARQQNVVAGIDLEAPARIDATSEEALFQHRRADRHRIGGERLGSIQRQVARLLIEQDPALPGSDRGSRSEEHTSELQSLMRNSYAVFCLKKKKHSD